MNKFTKKFKVVTLIQALLLTTAAQADVLQDIKPLQDRWAEANYSMSEEQQEKAYPELVKQANAVVAANPDKAEALIWRGIIKSSYAGVKGGLGAMSLAEESKADLEAALKIDSHALQGSAYTSLGVLYYKVPGWPIGFGSDKNAKKMLEKALSINPQGIDPNYFYAEFLTEERDYKAAMSYIEKAKQAAPRPDRPTADQGRLQDIAALEAKVAKKLKR
jgi:tetratricopeptide (TPR) repeat protein